MIYIVHYNQNKGMFILHTPGHGNPTLIEEIILKNVVFFVSEPCIDIIRNRAKTMPKKQAKFPHAFALSNTKVNMNLLEDKTLIWQDFEYDVFRHQKFVLKETQEPLVNEVQYVMIRGMDLKVVL